MLFKGRRQSSNVQDFRGRGGSGFGFRGGIIGTAVIALIVWILGGDPMSVLQDMTSPQQSTNITAPVAGEDEIGTRDRCRDAINRVSTTVLPKTQLPAGYRMSSPSE